MPSKMVQPLHIADSIDKLLKISEVKIPDLSLSACLDKMKKLHDSARKASLEKDQEQEFMFLHRYLLLLNMACKYPEYTKTSTKYRSDFPSAQSNMKKYELLRNILEKRYQENKEKDLRKNNKIIPAKSISPTQEKSLKDLNNTIAAGKFNKTCIFSQELYNLLSTRNNKESYLLIDARSSQDFKESHLNGSNIINIPEEIIYPGISASILNSKLGGNAKIQWEKRGTFDKLIIFDWNSSEGDLKSKALQNLKKAMTEWDPGTQYKCLPLVLEGGYEDILFKYPHITSNPKVQPPLLNNVNSLLSLDSFDYPIQELEPEEEKKIPVKEPETTLQPPKSSSAKSSHELLVDRSTKPTVLSTPEHQISDISLDSTEIVSQESISDSSSPIEEDSTPSEINEVMPKEETEDKQTVVETKSVLDELRKVKPSFDTSNRPDSSETGNVVEVEQKTKPQINGPNQSHTADKPVVEGTYKIPLKKDDGPPSSILKRSSSSPNIAKLDDEGISRIPAFTRANKPVAYAERADSTYGKTVAGLTGLKNFANNCYMNSILQCLSNTDPLVKELISINRPVATNPQSKTKGRVAQEVITAFRNMWSGDVRVYSIKDLKTLLGSLKEIFKGTGHQDSNEFLIILLEYLHDDLNIPASGESRLDGAREDTGEKAWGEFRRKNCSIIQRLFYGQHRSTVTCSTCQHQSVTFEQFFNLFVPIPSREPVSLSDCIQLYMSGEKISGWKCPKCKDERNATKKFDISRLPPILVIALKRFTHEEDSWLQKKENLVTYPLEDLDMERFTIKGSEQRYKRYNLYAMSTHTGTLRAGHYKAICRNHITNKWHMFDDQTVEALPAHSVRNNPEVYILFYNAVVENC